MELAMTRSNGGKGVSSTNPSRRVSSVSSITLSASNPSLLLHVEVSSIWVVTNSVDSPSCASTSSLEVSSKYSFQASSKEECVLGL
ncbi:hypothetical protein QL285_026089 [Trifolium repens]|nr:hypothetical protein QL285_026089 [Trifolium repens]